LIISVAEKQFCEHYKTSELGRQLGLTRDRLTLLALLLGSDYTEGISGIGIVNAMETLHVFPDCEALKEFKEWLESPDISRFEPIERRAVRVRARSGVPHLQEHGVLIAKASICVFRPRQPNATKRF
jgi:DNA excision repair protein ERCC-5